MIYLTAHKYMWQTGYANIRDKLYSHYSFNKNAIMALLDLERKHHKLKDLGSSTEAAAATINLEEESIESYI